MRKINPLLLLIIFSILVFLVRKYYFPEYTDLYGLMVMVPVVVLYLVNALAEYLCAKHDLVRDKDLPN